MTPSDDRRQTGAALTLATDAFVGAGAAAVEIKYPGAGVALAAVVPVLARVGEWAWSRVFSVAEDESGLPPDEIVRRLAAVENGVRLLGRTTDAVRIAPYEEKLRVLGRALARAALDQALIDEELLVVVAVAALEPYHLRLLRAGSKLSAREHQNGKWNTKQAYEVDAGLPPAMAELLVGVLVGQGLVTPYSAPGSPAYGITSLGSLLLDRVEAEASSTPEPVAVAD